MYEWIGPLIQLAAGAAGQMASQGDRSKSLSSLQQAQGLYAALPPPDFQRVTAQEAPMSALAHFTPDANLTGNEEDVLARLAAMDRGGGLGIEDKAALAEIGQQVAQQQRSAQAGLHASLARRGALGSGEDYATQAQLAQGAAQQANQAGLTQSSQALQRRMQALTGRGALASKMRGEDFEEKSGAARAADAINQYNASARAAAQQANNQNALATANWQLNRTGGQAGLAKDISGVYGQQAGDTQQLFAGVGKAGADASRTSALDGYSTADLNAAIRRRSGLVDI